MAKTDYAFIGVTVLCLDAVIDASSPPTTVDGVLVERGDRVLTPSTTAIEDRIVWIVEVSRWRPLAAFADGAELPLGLTLRVSAGDTHAGEMWHLRGRPPLIARRSDLGWYQDQTDTTTDAATRTVTSTDELMDSDELVWLDATAGAFTFTLTSAASRIGRYIRILRVNAGANVPIVAAAADETVAWEASKPLLVRGESLELHADGDTNWA